MLCDGVTSVSTKMRSIRSVWPICTRIHWVCMLSKVERFRIFSARAVAAKCKSQISCQVQIDGIKSEKLYQIPPVRNYRALAPIQIIPDDLKNRRYFLKFQFQFMCPSGLVSHLKPPKLHPKKFPTEFPAQAPKSSIPRTRSLKPIFFNSPASIQSLEHNFQGETRKHMDPS